MSRRLLLAFCCTLPFGPSARCAEPTSRVEVPYRLTDTQHVLVRAKLNGKGPFNFICDTGAPAVFVTEAVAAKAGAKVDAKGWANFDTFVLEGGLAVEKARSRVENLFQIEGMNGMGLAGVELHGVIGYNVLAKYRITYDFTSDKLAWEPLAGFDPPPLSSTRKGGGGQGGLELIGTLMKAMAAVMGVKVNFDVVPRGFVGIEVEERADGLFVKAVLPGTPAERSGLKAGDKIEAIRKAEVDDARDLRRALRKTLTGSEVTFTVRRAGNPIEIAVVLGKGL